MSAMFLHTSTFLKIYYKCSTLLNSPSWPQSAAFNSAFPCYSSCVQTFLSLAALSAEVPHLNPQHGPRSLLRQPQKSLSTMQFAFSLNPKQTVKSNVECFPACCSVSTDELRRRDNTLQPQTMTCYLKGVDEGNDGIFTLNTYPPLTMKTSQPERILEVLW